MKILEMCPYSSGICGVWTRVKQESIALTKKGHEVRIFSSNIEKETNKIVSLADSIEKIKIQRFPAHKLGGDSFLSWTCLSEALEYKPDVIIAHCYRHLHTTLALDVSKQLGCKCFLVTHAPFVEGNSTRGFISSMAVNLYDKVIGPRTLPKFDKILAISHWEVPELIRCGAPSTKIAYMPNGIPNEFFIQPNVSQEENKILFLGRITPIKNVETIIKALSKLEIAFELVGPVSDAYKKELQDLAIVEGVADRVIFSQPIFDTIQKINKIDSCRLFILPSKKEGMPQSLIEAMARKKSVIGSDIPSIKDLINNHNNGYLFKRGNTEDLLVTIKLALGSKHTEEPAGEYAKQFAWDILIDKLLTHISSERKEVGCAEVTPVPSNPTSNLQ